jgi:putative oxidoreductase
VELTRIVAPRPGRIAWAAALVRLVAGAIVFGAGIGKFVDHASEAASFEDFGLPSPSAFAYAIGVVEIVGGLLLLLGLGVRPAALLLAGNYVGAIATAGRTVGGPVHLVLAPLLLASMLALLWTGGGVASLDGFLARRRRS